MELNNTIATPLYKQLEEKIRKEIDTGERAAGSRLPTENELSETKRGEGGFGHTGNM